MTMFDQYGSKQPRFLDTHTYIHTDIAKRLTLRRKPSKQSWIAIMKRKLLQ